LAGASETIVISKRYAVNSTIESSTVKRILLILILLIIIPILPACKKKSPDAIQSVPYYFTVIDEFTKVPIPGCEAFLEFYSYPASAKDTWIGMTDVNGKFNYQCDVLSDYTPMYYGYYRIFFTHPEYIYHSGSFPVSITDGPMEVVVSMTKKLVLKIHIKRTTTYPCPTPGTDDLSYRIYVRHFQYNYYHDYDIDGGSISDAALNQIYIKYHSVPADDTVQIRGTYQHWDSCNGTISTDVQTGNIYTAYNDTTDIYFEY
jgi:hypothetical protein